MACLWSDGGGDHLRLRFDARQPDSPGRASQFDGRNDRDNGEPGLGPEPAASGIGDARAASTRRESGAGGDSRRRGGLCRRRSGDARRPRIQL